MPINDRTANLNLPKPNAANTLLEDVARLRDALDGIDAAIVARENPANKGQPGGYAGLDGTGKVPAAQLPSFVDDVVEYANLAAFPGTGETGKIYVALATNRIYRWSGSAYVEISPSPGSTDSVPEGSTNLYFTAARARSAQLPATASTLGVIKVGSGLSVAEDGTLSVPSNLPAATETASGIVELATNAEAQAGTDNTRAVTPAGAMGLINQFGLGGAAAPVPGNNIDDNTIPTGFYYVASTTSGTKPANDDDGAGHLIVSREGDGTTARQLYLDNTSSRIWTRTWAPSQWPGWVEIYHTGNLRDTVEVTSTNTIAATARTYVLTASLTLTLPATPTVGDWVNIVNRSGTTTPIVARNGQNIMGLAEDMILDGTNATLRLVFVGGTIGWVLN